MRPFFITAFLLLVSFTSVARGAENLSKYETWITGDVFTKKDQLLFRADKPVQGNATGETVLLGATKASGTVLLPAYAQAAEKHIKLRLYGYLAPVPDKPERGMPSVVFITWKMHLPSDPDELPVGQKIIIHEGDAVEGAQVRFSKPRK